MMTSRDPGTGDRSAGDLGGGGDGEDDADDSGSGYSRHESEADRLDRNYNELLQELRVAQTGVQILFAFLLTISFQPRFAELSQWQRGVYLLTLLSAAVSVALFIAPVAAHRVMFRQRVKDELVSFTGRLAATGLVFLAVAILGALLLIVDVVVGRAAAIAVASAGALLIAMLWFLLPSRLKRRS